MVNLSDSMSSESNLPWVEKYRPNSLDDLVSRKEIVNTINKLINDDRLPHLLFFGPPGTGKTSTILATARQIFSPKHMPSRVLELNASDERGINVVREKIVEFASSQGIYDLSSDGKRQIKLVILDEADAMTKDAQNALRRVIEKYTSSTRFCIICNYLSKIIPALQSRCTRFRFAPLDTEQMMPRLDFIIDKERVNIDKPGKEAVIKLSKGDMRKAINVLQCSAMSTDRVTEEAVYKCVGQPQPAVIKEIFHILLDKPLRDAYTEICNARLTHGLALSDILEELLDLVSPLDLPAEPAAIILDKMAKIESRLAVGCSEKIQTMALISAFIEAREAALSRNLR